MPEFLTVSSQLMCPHGGMVSAITSNGQVTAGGDPVVSATDTFLVAGCPFVLGVAPHPCMQVQWIVPAEASEALGSNTLTEASVGLCTAGDQAPQGPPMVVETQPTSGGT